MNKFRNIFLCLLLSVFLLSGCLPKEEAGSSSPERDESTEHILFGCPGTDGTMLYRKGYVLAHDNDKKVAIWVSYHLKDTYLVRNTGRTDDFRPDPDLPEGQRSELVDYRRSGYDRGHLAPAGDMTRSEEIMSESFLLSNMAPQVGVGFNRGIWRELESMVRDWARDRRNLYVITGPIYADEEYETIGPNNVAVPTHFYKIVVSCTESYEDLDAIAFILPNERTSSSLLETFITTIDNVEDLTSLDFMHELDDTIENDLESMEAEMW